MKSQITKFKGKMMQYPIGPHISLNRDTINKMAAAIKKVYPEGSIALWCVGSSGAIIAGGIALSLKKRAVTINYVRKEHEYTHSSMYIRHYLHNIIVDDFIATGNTIIYIKDIMKQQRVKPNCLCVSGSACKFADEFENIICS